MKRFTAKAQNVRAVRRPIDLAAGHGLGVRTEWKNPVKARETRHPVSLPARLRWQGNWLAARVRNISSHGLMLTLPEPPDPGTYVEVYVGTAHVVARTVWAKGHFCGMQSRETFDLSGLGSRTADVALAGGMSPREPVAHRQARAQATADASRRMASLFQYAIFAMVAATVASSLAWEVYNTLSAPMQKAQSALQFTDRSQTP